MCFSLVLVLHAWSTSYLYIFFVPTIGYMGLLDINFFLCLQHFILREDRHTCVSIWGWYLIEYLIFNIFYTMILEW